MSQKDSLRRNSLGTAYLNTTGTVSSNILQSRTNVSTSSFRFHNEVLLAQSVTQVETNERCVAVVRRDREVCDR